VIELETFPLFEPLTSVLSSVGGVVLVGGDSVGNKNKRDFCKCGAPKQASSRMCQPCSVPGMIEACAAYQQEKWKQRYQGTDAERKCDCGETFYSQTRRTCNKCRKRKRKGRELIKAHEPHPVKEIALLRASMHKVIRRNESGELAFRGWRCLRCGACCTDRKCVKCELGK